MHEGPPPHGSGPLLDAWMRAGKPRAPIQPNPATRHAKPAARAPSRAEVANAARRLCGEAKARGCAPPGV